MTTKKDKNKIKKPAFVKTTLGKVRLLITFRLINLFGYFSMSIYWLISIFSCAYVFNYVRIPGSIINLDQAHIQLIAFLIALYSIIKLVGSLINKIKININDKFLVVSCTPLPLVSSESKLNSKNIIQLYVDFKDGTFSTHYIVNVLMKNQNTIELISTRDPQLAAYIESRIEKHLNIPDFNMSNEEVTKKIEPAKKRQPISIMK